MKWGMTRLGFEIATFFYWLCFSSALVFGAGVVLFRRPIHSLMSLIGVMISLAGIFALMRSEFVAIVQILVYAGAVVVLFLFVIMLLNLRRPERDSRATVARPVIAAMLLVIFAGATAGAVFTSGALKKPVGPHIEQLQSVEPANTQGESPEPAGDSATSSTVSGGESLRDIARMILSDEALPFELVSILLLVAIVGVVAATRVSEPGRSGTGGVTHD
jgi:NADH-quinone oxidoreductase subunit J